MSVAAVAFVPSAPLLVPEVAGGSAAVDAGLRSDCLAAVEAALRSAPEMVTVVAPVTQAGAWTTDAAWSFAGFGVDREVPGGSVKVPWQLGIAAWLLDECGWTGPRRYLGLDASSLAAAPDVAPGSAVLAVGDGSACRIERAPGYLDARAEPFDAHIAGCLARGDVHGLAAIDPALAGDLRCPSLPVWRWLAAAINGELVSTAELLTAVAPYGVGYFAAVWTFPHRLIAG